MGEVTSYSATELNPYPAEDLTALAAALEAQGLAVRDRALRVGGTAVTEWHRIAEPQWLWRFASAGGEEWYGGPEPEVAAPLAAVEAPGPPARAARDGCSQRVFDLGCHCGTRPFAVRHDLSAGTLARLAAAGGSLRFTLDAFDPSGIGPA